MARRPSSSGISRSISTTSGAWARTFRSASMPSRAVATTWNSPEPSSTSVRSRRKKGLSSTTRTRLGSEMLDTVRHRNHFYSAIGDVEANGTPEITTHRLSDQWYGVTVQHLSGGHQITLSHADRAGRRKGSEHARTPGQPCRDTPHLRSSPHHQLEQTGHCGLRELGRVGIHASQRRRRQENVSQPSNARGGVVKHDSNAT